MTKWRVGGLIFQCAALTHSLDRPTRQTNKDDDVGSSGDLLGWLCSLRNLLLRVKESCFIPGDYCGGSHAGGGGSGRLCSNALMRVV